MLKYALGKTLHFGSRFLTFITVLSVVLAATWDGTKPCLACGCSQCSDFLNQTCKTWFAWKNQWELDIWPAVWMGISALAILLGPCKWRVSKRMLNIALHVVNILWLILTITPLLWRPVQTRCKGNGLTFALTYIGLATGRLCGINLCLLLVSVGRSSAWLNQFCTDYTKAISIHRTAGWWCIAHVVVHVLAFLARYWLEGGWALLTQKLLPVKTARRLNTRGMLNFYGVLGLTGGLVLAGFAIERVRRPTYGVFYNVHVVSSAAFILLGSMHDVHVLLYTLPACSYIFDRIHARFWSQRSLRAQLEVLAPHLVKLSMSLSYQGVLVPGSRWLYLKVPCVSNEWHPFSITGPANSVVLHIKVAGDRSRSLCALAATHRDIDIFIEGPYGVASRYGCKFSGNLRCGCPFSSRGLALKPSLLLVAGGVGIVPFADLLDGSQLSTWNNVTVIWAIRSEGEYRVLEHSLSLRAHSSEHVQIHVYITQPTARDAIVALESMAPALQMQDNQSQPVPIPSIGLALQSRIVGSCAPGLVLLLAIKMQSQLFTSAKLWQSGVFSWSLATHGSELVVSYFIVILSALCLTLPVYAAWRATRETCLKDLLRFISIARERQLSRLPVHQQQAMPTTLPQPFLIKEGRPDISKIVCSSAQEGTALSVHACGSSSLLDEVRRAVSKARAARQRVELTIEQSEW